MQENTEINTYMPLLNKRVTILLPGNTIFGQERALVALGELIRDCGGNVDFIIHKQWGIGEISNYLENKKFAWEVYPFGTLWMKNRPKVIFFNLISLFICSCKFLSFKIKRKPDLLICGNYTFTWYILPAIFVTRQKLLFRFGDVLPSHNIVLKLLNKLILLCSSEVVSNCCYLSNCISQEFNIDKPLVIYNKSALEKKLSHKQVANKKTKNLLDTIKILYVGQISEHKGVDILLNAVTRILESQKYNIELYLVGKPSGVDKEQINSLSLKINDTCKLFPEKVHWIRDSNDPVSYYESSDIHVCPSLWAEPSPNVVFEAKSFALPSVIFPVGGLPELVEHMVDGFICKSTSEMGLIEGISYFLENPNQRNNCSKMALLSSENKFSASSYRHSWLRCLQTILA
ncbi:glycosyltransferase family 4 protein [Prochlorothrix hollandica]|uniref:glycosyltransferase family 4 protein n=1 Tax=Prochlorothrix hollandica TaxID=1223 RepID=UPI0003652BF9|nr:glycosyltransferase family 4 protein [Prochlorothrix hollandica]